MTKSLFLSYSHQDSACAGGIARFLKKNDHAVWIDSESIEHGERWMASIDEAISQTDAFVALISKNSVRRPEVVREISDALKRNESDPGYRVVFVVIGFVHESWFASSDEDALKRVKKHYAEIQFVKLNAKGSITLEAMRELLRALDGKAVHDFSEVFEEGSGHIFEAGNPKKAYDEHADGNYYRVTASDLSPSTVFPFSLDNQWLPDELMHDGSILRERFLKEGFASAEVQEHLDLYRLKNLFISLIHSRQMILNRASILNCGSLRKIYDRPPAGSQGSSEEMEREAFKSLLQDGSIIVFLYGREEVTPSISRLPEYSTEEHAVKMWNELCSEVQMYCIRENWDNPVDRHKTIFAKHCSTLALDDEANNMIAECLNLDLGEKRDFFITLKDIAMCVFGKTHVLGPGHQAETGGYSRSSFYRDFVVGSCEQGEDYAVLNCIFDEKKPFHMQLKKLIDVFYNSVFANSFACTALIPTADPEDTFIHHLYLKHGSKEVTLEELEYAFSDFMKNESLLKMMEGIGGYLDARSWNMQKIAKYRRTAEWCQYIELLEYITTRSEQWMVDFNDVERLVEHFVESLKALEAGDEGTEEAAMLQERAPFVPAYTFRICIGSRVMDVVYRENARKMRIYKGALSDDDQNSLLIQFVVGDALSPKHPVADTIFPFIKIFDGKTDHMNGSDYFRELKDFFEEQGFANVY